MRPWNADEWGAFVSWVFLGHIVWILAGTTTFFSLLILSINTVLAQETLATWVGDYLTKSAGVTVVFESAIVPKWRSGVISFRNVFISRRPGQKKSSVSKGSSANAAAVAAASKQPADQTAAAAAAAAAAAPAEDDDDGNYTQFDLTIANVNVTLSLLKWWNGKGLLEDVEVRGVRGVVDRTSVHWTPQASNDPYSYRYKHQSGDFEIESFKLEDLLVTVCQPNGFRPFAVSIYSCDLDRLRKRWLFYDFLSANHMSGSFDGSLFTIHPRQVHSPMIGGGSPIGGVPSDDDAAGLQRLSRLRIDGLNIDHLNRGVQGPFGWIYEGNVDIVADVMFPADDDGRGLGKVMSDLYEEMIRVNRARLPNFSADWVPTAYYRHARQQEEEGNYMSGASGTAAVPPAPSPPAHPASDATNAAVPPPASADEHKYMVMDLRMHLNDVRAAVPLFSRDILVRPIVAYLNAKRTYIPLACQIVKRAADFDGSWTIFDCGLMTDMSAHAYDAFARDVEDQQSRVRRLKKVGLWTLSVALHAVFMGMAGQAL
jgi:distribution and morphology protein 31